MYDTHTYNEYTVDSAYNELNGTFKYRSLYPKFGKSEVATSFAGLFGCEKAIPVTE
jgi:hypothetical protein